MLSSHEIPLIGALAEVTADALRQIGVNVDLQESDWGTLVVRRASRSRRSGAAGASSAPAPT